MRRRKILLIAPVVMAMLIVFFLTVNDSSEPDYTLYATHSNGVSLLYDTLHRMNYPVAADYTPLTADSGVNDAYLIIHPDNPSPDWGMIEDMLDWVRMGGRLIYLDDDYPTIIDTALQDSRYTDFGDMTHYEVGLGEVVTGFAEDVVNENLMSDSYYGSTIANILDSWNADHVYFSEYYHGYRQDGNFFAHLPLIIKLMIYQTILFVGAYVWYKGKRFGKAVPYYEETEREENEHVKALARLYYIRRVKNKKKKG